MEELTQALRQLLEHCLDQGMVLPFIAVSAASNGTIFAVRYNDNPGGEGLHPEALAVHEEGPGLLLPINIMIMDQTGEAVRMQITATGDATLH